MSDTVSSESAPSAVNLDSPVTGVPSANASCFFTISHTFSTVSGLACSKTFKVINEYEWRNTTSTIANNSAFDQIDKPRYSKPCKKIFVEDLRRL